MTTYEAQPYEIVPWDTSAGNGTLKFPAGPSNGMQVGVKKITEDLNTVTLDGNGGTFETIKKSYEQVSTDVLLQPGVLYIWQYQGTPPSGLWLLRSEVKALPAAEVWVSGRVDDLQSGDVLLTWSHAPVLPGDTPYFFTGGTTLTAQRRFNGFCHVIANYEFDGGNNETMEFSLSWAETFGVSYVAPLFASFTSRNVLVPGSVAESALISCAATETLQATAGGFASGGGSVNLVGAILTFAQG